MKVTIDYVLKTKSGMSRLVTRAKMRRLNNSSLLYDSINVYVPINGLLAIGQTLIVSISDRFIIEALCNWQVLNIE